MERALAVAVVSHITSAIESLQTTYRIESIATEGEELTDFHHWADWRELVGVFKIEQSDGKIYYFLFIDWRESGNFYLVTYPQNRSKPLTELHEIEEIGNGYFNLCWTYMPTKRDGRNPDRKNLFEKYYRSLRAQITLPRNTGEVEDFLSEVFCLCNDRISADNLQDETAEYRNGFPEGNIVERMHRYRERSSKLVELVKKNALIKYGKLYCEVCGFDFAEKYGKAGNGFIQVHHKVPLSELKPGGITKESDLSLVCANCHEIIHWHRPWINVNDLKMMIKA